jgi:A/G-specific adenine glycosylase
MPVSRSPKKPPLPLPPPADRRRFRQRLLAWYRRHGRDLPWRKTSDPYHILVSEIMLQQTQVDRVLPKYHEWLQKYPSLRALAAAPEQEVTDTWYPLGYNIRPRRLQTIARESVYTTAARCRPTRRRCVVQGIGAYTAGAIRFRLPRAAAILDTNVARVLFRIFVGTGDQRATRRNAICGSSRDAGAKPPRLRLQSSADGLRGDGVRRAESPVPHLPDGQELPLVSIQP